MGKLSDLFVRLKLDNKQYDSELQKSGKKTSSFGKGIAKIGGLIAGAFAVGAIKGFASESIKLFNIQAQAENQLLVALKGRSDIQNQLIKQATELQGKTLFGDEETIQAQALIAAFVKEGDQIKKVIPLVQDLATAKGMQLSAAADLVSKTLGSSTNALSRYGVEVEGAVGSVQRLESLMGGLNNAFGGQAEAAAKVGTGALKQLGNAFGDLKEVIGELIITQQNQQGSITKGLTETSNKVTGFLKKVATFSKTGIGFKTSLIATIFGSEEDFNMVENALNATSQSIDQVNSKTKSFVLTGDELREMTDGLDASFMKLSSDLTKATDGVDAWFEAWTAQADVSGIVGGGGVFGMVGDEQDQDLGFDTEAYVAKLEETQAFVDEMNSIISNGMADFVSTFAEGIGRLASGDISFDQFFDSILNQIGGFLVQFGSALIAYGVASDAFTKAFSNPYVAIAAGVALVAIGGLISSMGSKGPQGFSGGGGSISTGNVSGFRAQSAQDTDNRVVFELQGTKLVGAINNTNRRNSIIG